MAIKGLETDLQIISRLGDNPGLEQGLSATQLRAKFDEAAEIIKEYINNYLVNEINKLGDVDFLLSDFLDDTLYQQGKAADAKAVYYAVNKLRELFSSTVHQGDYVLDYDGNFAASVSGEAAVRISGGVGVMVGNLFALNVGTGVDVELKGGSVGQNRNDLIVVRAQRDAAGNLSFDLASVSGQATTAEAKDPGYTQGDINADGSVREFPLYRVKLAGYDIVAIEPLFTPEKTLEKQIQDIVENSHMVKTAALEAAAWQGDKAPYTQTVNIPGILATDVPHISPVYAEDLESKLAQREAWMMVSDAETADGSITFTCFEDKPATGLFIQIEVNR